jgi:hypothetical protein
MTFLFEHIPMAFAIYGGLVAVIQLWHYIVLPLISKFSGLSTVAKADVTVIEARVRALEAMLGLVVTPSTPSTPVPIPVPVPPAASKVV